MIVVGVKYQATVAWLFGYTNRLNSRLLRVMQRLAIELQGNVKEDKLSGQVLHVRTGTLRRSINQRVESSGSQIVATVGTNVEYAAIHEYGFHGQVTVREHLRRSRAQMGLARFRMNKLGERIEVKGSYAKAGGGNGEVYVRSHTREVDLPERSFLRSALREMQPKIIQEIHQASVEAAHS